jgi:hypothetical protein
MLLAAGPQGPFGIAEQNSGTKMGLVGFSSSSLKNLRMIVS